MVNANFKYEKETKNSVRFQELGDDDEPSLNPEIGTIYIKKWAWTQMGKPMTVNVTINAVVVEG